MDKKDIKSLKRYENFTLLETPVPFNEMYKNIDIPIVQVHSLAPAGENDIVGFCGAFKWTNNTIDSIDGDTYNEEMMVHGYKWFSSSELETNCLDILVENDW